MWTNVSMVFSKTCYGIPVTAFIVQTFLIVGLVSRFLTHPTVLR